jgi:RNA polymerase sigma factor (TIGR02999 family)
MSEFTRILSAIEQGDPHATQQLLPLVYEELRKLAAARMEAESVDHTLQATALVHEGYLRLVDGETVKGWDNRGHFFSAAAEAMRRILIENARRKASVRHGGLLQRRILDEDALSLPSDTEDLLALDEAINRLAQVDAEAAELVKLRFFAGLSVAQAAALLGMSTRSAYHAWGYARAWLRRAIRGD